MVKCSLFFLVSVMTPVVAAAQPNDVSSLARRLATLRSEVDDLSEQLQTTKEGYRAQLRSLAEQKAELEVQLRREGLRLEQLQATQARQKEKNGDQAALDETLRPVLLEALDTLRARIAVGLPFRVDERIADLERLEMQVKTGLLRSQDAAHRLWQTLEDELRLARESGLYRHTIELDDQALLADVARIGMVALYFRTHDKRYGWAIRQGDGWSYTVATERRSKKQLAQLFDSFKKQVRVGLFELPNALQEVDSL